jgi:subtilisin family serine protease
MTQNVNINPQNFSIYAPGSDIYCANLDSGYQKISGTSMACPIVAGVMAQYFQYNNSLTTYDITDTIYRSRTRGNVVTGSTGRPAPLIQIPTEYDLLLLNTTLVSMFNSYV